MARTLAQVLGGKPADYRSKLAQDSGFVYIGRKVDLEKASALECMKLAGLGFLEDSRRLYPSGSLACQVLGFVGVDDEGLSGLEARYDEVLAGKPGVLLAERDPFGREIPGGVVKSIDPVQGKDIVLTIDKDIQAFAQVELAKAVRYWGAKSGAVIVMSPKTGEIYAMASTPYFNPNNTRRRSPRRTRTGRCWTPTSRARRSRRCSRPRRSTRRSSSRRRRCNLPSTLHVGGETIRESHRSRCGERGRSPRSSPTRPTSVPRRSAWPWAARSSSASLGPFRARPSRPESISGARRPAGCRAHRRSRRSPIATVSFGQGISATPLQLTRAFGALGNKGIMTTPHFLLSGAPESAADVADRARRDDADRCGGDQHARAVVMEGTGSKAEVPGYNVAGKTGTAQVALPNGARVCERRLRELVHRLPPRRGPRSRHLRRALGAAKGHLRRRGRRTELLGYRDVLHGASEDVAECASAQSREEAEDSETGCSEDEQAVGDRNAHDGRERARKGRQRRSYRGGQTERIALMRMLDWLGFSGGDRGG